MLHPYKNSGDATIRVKLIMLLVVVSISLSAHAQFWTHKTVSDPMTDNIYDLYVLQGNWAGTVNGYPSIALACRGHKLKSALFESPELILSLTGGIAVKIRYDNGTVPLFADSLPLTDIHTAKFGKGEIKRLVHAKHIVIEFYAADGDIHYAKFDNTDNDDPIMLDACGIH